MRKTFLAIVAVAAVAGVPGRSADAMPAAPLAPAIISNGAMLQPVVNVCGMHGCTPVQTKRIIRRQKPGSVAAHHI